MKDYKTKHENDIVDYMKLQFKELSYRLGQKYNSKKLKELHKRVIKKEYKEIIRISKEILGKGIIQDQWDIRAFTEQISMYENYWELVKDEYNEVYGDAREAFVKEWEKKESEGTEMAVDKDKYAHEKSHEIALEAIRDYTSDILTSNGAEKP